jgi:aminotransferase MxcL
MSRQQRTSERVRDGLLDVTTTSVGRSTLVDTYASLLDRVRFTGRFRMIVTIDPAYGVGEAELRSTRAFLADLRGHPMVADVIVEEFGHQVGLHGALTVLMAHAQTPVGLHLEDDWTILDTIDLDELVADLYDQDSTQICLANTHVARGGTFDAPGAVEDVTGTRTSLLRFTPASWVAPYLPLCPHVHRAERWRPTVARALATSDPMRCPDERIKELLINEGSVGAHNVLWTRQVLARDTGRQWLANRGLVKSVTPAHDARPPQPPLPGRAPRLQAGSPRSAGMAPAAALTLPARVPPAESTSYRFLDRGQGAVVWDVDGASYVDLDSGQGTAILGHNHPLVTNTIRERAAKGVRLPATPASELAVAQLLVAAVPGSESAHLASTADEARRFAAALARLTTGRDGVLYAGASDGKQQDRGDLAVPVASADDVSALLDLVCSGRWAAMIVRPPLFTPLDIPAVRKLRDACEATDMLMVLDETDVTLRTVAGGLSAMYRVTADLVILSPAVAAGMPLAGLVGRHDVLRHLTEMTMSGCRGPDLLSVEVAKIVLREHTRHPYFDHFAGLGTQLCDGLNHHAARWGWRQLAAGYASVPCLRFAAEPARHRALLAEFADGMAAHGVLIGGDVLYVTAAHTSEQIQFVIDAAAASLRALAAAGHPGR